MVESHAPIGPPRIVAREAFLVMGFTERYNHSSKRNIPLLWARFAPHIGRMPGEVQGVTYGVIAHADATGSFDYTCAVEVLDFPSGHDEFSRLRIPAQSYAVFEHRAHISSLESTISAIWGRELETAQVRATGGPVLERYDERFDPDTGLGGLEVWVPIAV